MLLYPGPYLHALGHGNKGYVHWGRDCFIGCLFVCNLFLSNGTARV